MVSGRRVKKITDLFIPDELVLNIVSRLPAKDVIRCRHVCKGWRNSTSTQEFLDLHMLRQEGNFPLILVEKGNMNQGFHHFLFEKWWETSHSRSRVQKFQFPMYTEYRLQFSLDGLIVLKQTYSLGNYIIVNPINGENVKISLSREISASEIFGVFFHPSLKEYCTLWRVTTLPEQLCLLDYPRQLQYKLLNLGPDPCWRNIKNKIPVGCKIWIERRNPLSVDNYIYWMVYDQDMEVRNSTSNMKIMEFDVKGQELTLITAPWNSEEFAPVQVGIIKRLLNNGGVLSMVEIYLENQLLVACISTLINRSLQLWTKTRLCFNDDPCRPWRLPIEPIAFADKQLVFFSDDGIFFCNLELGTVKKFGRMLGENTNVFSHVMTLASLKGCKSEFCMGYQDEEKSDTQWFQAARKQISGSKSLGSQDPTSDGKGSTSNGKASENNCYQMAVANIRRKA